MTKSRLKVSSFSGGRATLPNPEPGNYRNGYRQRRVEVSDWEGLSCACRESAKESFGRPGRRSVNSRIRSWKRFWQRRFWRGCRHSFVSFQGKLTMPEARKCQRLSSRAQKGSAAFLEGSKPDILPPPTSLRPELAFTSCRHAGAALAMEVAGGEIWTHQCLDVAQPMECSWSFHPFYHWSATDTQIAARPVLSKPCGTNSATCTTSF